MAEIHYLISDASKKVDVESHVLRYWEEELGLTIPRNEMGHRYYTELHIRLFQKIKELKEKGYQLKAIKSVLSKMIGENEGNLIQDGGLEEDVMAALKEGAVSTDKDKERNETSLSAVKNQAISKVDHEERMEQFQQIMNHIIGRAIEANNEKLSQDVGQMVNDRISQEFEYMIRVNDEKAEERFKQLDETLRAFQKDGKGRAEAAATRIPFFKKKKLGKKGKKF